ncbi:MAG: 3-oxoacyl-ACP synthase [Bacteroidia bacterium]
MNSQTGIKEQILRHLHELLDRKIAEASRALESAKESRDSDTKSSAGDQYETGRAMMQIEMENYDTQLNNALELKKALTRLNISREIEEIEPGSFVVTNHGKYFISIGLGKITVNDEVVYAISLASPIGQMFKDKRVGDKFEFNGREYLIQEII